MENMILGNIELNKVDAECLNKIKNDAIINYTKFIETNTLISKPKKNTTGRIKTSSFDYFHTLEDSIINCASAIRIINKTEKTIFICSGIFPDDEKFLNTLKSNNFINLLDTMIQTNNYLENKYNNNMARQNTQKLNYYRRYIKENEKEINQLMTYFFKFHKIRNFYIIINKLSQICCFNPELYNSYVEPNEDKKTSQKTNKIG